MPVGNWSKNDVRSWKVRVGVRREDKTHPQHPLRYVYMQTQCGLSGLRGMEGNEGNTKAQDERSSLGLNAQGAGSPRIIPGNRKERIKEGGNECVKDKLDQHMLSSPGRHTLESQELERYLARVSNLLGLLGFPSCLLRKGGRKGGGGGR